MRRRIGIETAAMLAQEILPHNQRGGATRASLARLIRQPGRKS